MSDVFTVLLKIATMFLVMALGWVARRRNYLTEETTRSLIRFVVDLVFPALVFTQMLRTVNAEVLRAGWFVPILGAAVIVIALAVGRLSLPVCGGNGHRPTIIFLAGIPNWVYLPLPIVQGLYGDAGVRDVLLYNVGCQVVLWSLGVWTLSGTRPDLKSLKQVALNPGLLATLAGVLLAVLWPGAQDLESVSPGKVSFGLLGASAVVQALSMLGSLTIPLSLLVTGAQLGGLNLISRWPSRELTGVILIRLLIAPAITVALVLLLGWAGLTIPEMPRRIAYLIAAMPVAISCSIMAGRFRGDTLLSAQAIFYSTLLSILTVPAFYWLVRTLGW